MKIRNIYKAVLSILTTVAILLGSCGFIMLSHECSYSGHKVYALAADHSHGEVCCDHDENNCCDTEEQDRRSCSVIFSEEKNCCKHELATLQLPGFTISDKNSEKDFPFIAKRICYSYLTETKEDNQIVFHSFLNQHGGKQKLLINCQFLA